MCIIKDIYVYNAEDKLLLAFAHTHIPILSPTLFLFYSGFIIVFVIFLFLGIIYVLNLYNIGISSLFVNGLFINSCGLSHQTHQTNITANRPSDRSFDQSNKQTKYQKGKPMDKTNNKSYQQKQYQRSNIITLNITH